MRGVPFPEILSYVLRDQHLSSSSLVRDKSLGVLEHRQEEQQQQLLQWRGSNIEQRFMTDHVYKEQSKSFLDKCKCAFDV